MRLAAMAWIAATPLSAQLGELQVGAVTSYGTSTPYHTGAGLVFGVAPGRLVYVGLRWIYYAGTTTAALASPSAGPADVRNRAQVFASDYDVEIPIYSGLLELRPSIGLGIVRFAQRGRSMSGVIATHSKEFIAAPGVALQISAGRVGVIPEIQYYFTGHTELPWPVRNKSLALSVSVVFLSEIRRIRR
jgi:hypothetical protein